jgi:hypothetical protein
MTLLKRFSSTVRRALGRPNAVADGGVQATTPTTERPLGIPPDDPHCSGDCSGNTEPISVSELLESENTVLWSIGNDLQKRDIEMVSRCTECGGLHDEIAL